MQATKKLLRRTGLADSRHTAAALLETLEQRQLLAVDLVAAFINAQSHTLAPGEDFAAALVVNNDGSTDSPAFSVELRLSSDGVFGNSDDIVLGIVARPSGIAASSSASLVNSFTIPNGTPAGSYSLAFVVDPDSLVSESNENNNVTFSLSQLITVTPPSNTDVDLDVFGNSQEIADGAHVPSAGNGTFFDDVDLGQFQEQAFTLTNDGAGTLQILGVTITGENHLDFVIIGSSTFSLGAGQSANLTVRFAPLADGIRVGRIEIQTNDSNDGTGDPSVFSFAISGAAHQPGDPAFPEIDVQGNGNTISDGDLTPSLLDGTRFGRLLPNNALQTRTFTIFNTGDSTLNITGLEIIGRDTDSFFILDSIDSIAPGDSATFRARFDPAGVGKKIAQVRVLSNDFDEGTYNFKLFGRGALNGGVGDGSAEINVQGNGQSIADGDTSPSAADRTTFGRVAENDATRRRTFTIFNPGTATLEISSISLFGLHADNFTIVDAPSEVLAGETATFRVRFNPDGLGSRRADVLIVSNDDDEGSFTFRVRGNGINNSPDDSGAGEINVIGLLPIESGDTTARLVEGTHFGPVNVGASETVSFTITNIGTGTLNLTGAFVDIVGRNPARFSIIQMPSGSLGVGQGTTFIVQFDPLGPGLKRATIQIHSDDQDESLFTFDVVGRGIA